jgi:Porin subfamily
VNHGCNPDFALSELGIVTRWTPVKNLTFSGELMWTRLDQKFTGFSVFSPGAPQAVQAWNFKDQDTLSLNVRVQRNL